MPFNVGVGGAMRTAFLYAQRNGFDAVVQVDADGQHMAEHIPELLGALERASVVVGARFTDGYDVRGPRRWAMRTLARSLSRVCEPRSRTRPRASGQPTATPSPCSPGTTPPSTSGTQWNHWSSPRAQGSWWRRSRSDAAQTGRTAEPVAPHAALYLGRALLALYVALSRGLPRPSPTLTAVAMNANWLGLAAAALLLGFVLELLRRGILRERFAALWLAVCAILAIVAVFPGILRRAAGALGFELPRTCSSSRRSSSCCSCAFS